MRQVLSVVLLLLVVLINFLLDLVDLGLNVAETPLLGLLHLNHHLLDLFELLKAVCLHLLELLLLLDEHIQASLLVSSEECVRHRGIPNFQSLLSLGFEAFIELICLFRLGVDHDALLLNATRLDIVSMRWPWAFTKD